MNLARILIFLICLYFQPVHAGLSYLCTGQYMVSSENGLIADFNTPELCQEGLKNSKNGFTCLENYLIAAFKIINEYSNQKECIEAVQSTTGRLICIEGKIIKSNDGITLGKPYKNNQSCLEDLKYFKNGFFCQGANLFTMSWSGPEVEYSSHKACLAAMHSAKKQ